MYIARFETDDGEWIQAVAVINATVTHPAPLVSVYWDEISRHLSSAARIPESTVVHRIKLDDRQCIRQTLSVTVPAELERRLREVMARLTRLERMHSVSISFSQRREERDHWFEDLGPLHVCASSVPFSVRNVKLACDFRVAPFLDDLLIDACLGEYALTYQIHVRYSEIQPEWQRVARKNALALYSLSGAPTALIEWQENLARALGHASAFCEEYLVVDMQEVCAPISSLLMSRFRSLYRPLGFSSPDFRFKQDTCEDSLVLGMHSHDLNPISPVELCGVALTAAERDHILSWKPSQRLLTLLSSDTGEGAEIDHAGLPLPDGPSGEMLPAPYIGSEPFAFVSYKRQDLDRIIPIMNLLRDSDIRLWYDRGIPGGAEWDKVIEDRLSKSHFVLLFTSQKAIDSKYVRREVKFADALDIPLLTILLEDVELLHGMYMLLTQYQMIDVRKDDFPSQLRLALDYLS